MKILGFSLFTVAFLLLSFTLSDTSTAPSAIEAGTPVSEGLKVGDTAPDFSLKGVDGKMHALADMKEANGFVVIFTCNSCPYSIAYEDRIIALHEEFAPKGYPVIAINPNDPEVKSDDSFKNMQVRAMEKGFSFPYLFDEGQRIYPQYGATRTPHVFLLDGERKVVYIGSIDDNIDAEEVKVNFLANAINALDSGEAIDPSFTKAIGCSIKKKG